MRDLPSGRRSALLVLALAALAPAAASAAPRTADDRDGNKLLNSLDSRLERSASSDRVDVIVVFADPGSRGERAEAEREVGDFAVKYHYRTLSAVAAEMTERQVRELARDPDVDRIQLDAPMRADLDTARQAFGVNDAAAPSPAGFGVTGNNESGACPAEDAYCAGDSTVAVIDTGIHAGHVDLDGGKVLGFANCLNTTSCSEVAPFDDHGHGTHVASTIGGSGDGSVLFGRTMKGVAPGASLVGVKVLSSSGSGSTSGVDAGVEWVIANRARFGIDALNMSLGSGGSSGGTDTTSKVVNRAAAAGITPFVSAGNSGPGPRTIGSPAAAKFAVTVGALADPRDADGTRGPGFSLASFSSRGPTADGRRKPDVAGAGVDVMAARHNTTSGYVSMSGTSMSSPFTAGTGALMLDASPALGSSGAACASGDTSSECSDGVIDSTMSTTLKDALTGAAADWGPAGADNDFGFGRLDAYAALDAASAATGDGGPALPAHAFFDGSLSGTGATANHVISVQDTSDPIAVAMVMASWSGSSSPDFDLYLIGPTGTQVALAEGVARQETVSFNPTTTGDYTIRVSSWTGSGPYWLDASYAGMPPPPDTTPPAAPTGLSATPGDGRVTLNWSANGEPDLSGYRVYRDGGTTPIATPTANSYTNTGLSNGTAYGYTVTAVDRSGNESAAAGPVSATPVAPPAVKSYAAAGLGPTIGKAHQNRSALSRLSSDDGSRVEYNAVLSGGTYVSEIQPWTTIASAERAALKKLTINFNGGVSSSSAQHTVSVKNQATGQWQAFLGPLSGTTSDRSATFTTSSSPADYVSAAGEIRIKVTGTRSSSGWRTATDWVRFTIEY